MYNRRYDKVFLMLRQETAGYGMGQRTPWGSCVMEIKNGGGRLSLTVQGLRPLRRGQYAVYALAGEREETEGFFCGALQPDNNGYGELKWDFNPDSLQGGAERVEALHTVVVLTEDGGSVPMSASFGEKKAWRKDFKQKTEMKKLPVEPLPAPRTRLMEIERAVEEPVLAAEEETAEETVLVAAEAALAEPTVALEEESYHGSFRGLLAKFKQEMEELQERGVFGEEDVKEISNAGKANPLEQETALGTEERNTAAPETDFLFQGNREIQPFGEEGGIWKCISLEETVLLEGLPLVWQKDCFFLLPLKKYHHLIYRKAGAGYTLGVPGMFTAEDGQKAKEMGFAIYRPMEESQMGYWLWEKK